ncbi:MAG TPA: rhombosortase [Steroidobacteraceae bacterium]|nr:rhombosortase [Steroidobacteraceae bacterium]
MGVAYLRDRVHGALASLNCDGRRGLALLALCLLLVAATLPGDSARRALRYDRAGLAAGQYWRLLSAHLVHLDLRHALLNTLGLALMWALFARDYSPRQWLIIVLASIAAIDAGLWLGDSTVLWYVGSSGALHGVMAAGTVAHLRAGERDGWILAALLLAKLAYEQWAGPLPLSGSDPVVVDAHLYGVLGGALMAAGLKRRPLPL